jgi:hypothetical protein
MEFTGFQSVQNTYFNFDIAAYLIRIMFVKQGDVLIRTTAGSVQCDFTAAYQLIRIFIFRTQYCDTSGELNQ